MTDLSAIWPALRRLRERRGLSLAETAHRCGIDRSHISALELGRAPGTTLNRVLRILRALDYSLSALDRETRRGTTR